MTTLGRHPDALTVKLTLGDGAHLIATAANGWAGPVTLHYGPKTGDPVISDVGTVDGDEVSWTLTEAEVTARAEHDWARLEDNGVTIAAGPVMTWLGGSGHTVTQTIASLIAGPPGPTAVSADADNVATLGTDGLIYVSPADSGAFSDAAVSAFVADEDSDTYAAITALQPDLSGYVETTDPRLSDARTPTAHEHTAADVDSGASSDGQVLTSDGAGGAAWETPASGVTDHGLLSGLGDDDHTQYALADGSRGAFAPPLGADDNYVTDAEKAALHSHSNKAALDLVSGTNTGDQVLPTWSTISGKPAVVAAGATQADARTAIGAGTSSFSGDYDDLTDKPTLGDAAAKNTGTTAGTVAAGDHLHDARYVTVVEHGAVAGTARPAGATVVLWIGSVEPTNAVAGDQWDDASGTPSVYYTQDEVDALLADKADVTQAINAQTGTAYTAVSGDAGKLTTLTNASPIALTIATLPAGTRLDFRQGGAGAVTVAGSGVTLRAMPGMTLVSGGQYARFSVDFVTSTEADVIGWMEPA